MKPLNVQLLLTGNELMTGDIVDSNSAMVAQQLKNIGLTVSRKVTVADDLPTLVNEIKYMSAQADILIINGGLGPTTDDMTALALANAMNKPLTSNSEALTHLKKWCKKRNSVLNEPNIKQTILPENCQIIPNESGSAVGILHTYQKADIYCTPGVPRELSTMMVEQIIPRLSKNIPIEQHLDVTRLQIFGMGESILQKIVDENIPHWPENIELGFRAGKPLLEIKLTTNESKAKQNKQQYIDQLYQLFGDHIVAEVVDKPHALAQTVVELLINKNKKITLAESCTGGEIASMLTKVAGVSSVFEAGFVTYSNIIKEDVLGVRSHTLKNYGAVSQQTVIEMAQGALNNTGSDLAIAVSGIAGPTGGTPEKPVGTVWIAWGSIDDLQSQCLLISAPRTQFQYYVANIGLDLIRRLLISSKEIPRYINEYGR